MFSLAHGDGSARYNVMGQRNAAIASYEEYLPLINDENKQCGLRATKALMREGAIIASEAVHHPIAPLPPALRAGLVELAQRLDPLILHGNQWAVLPCIFYHPCGNTTHHHPASVPEAISFASRR